jgi:hypothetical protein
VKEWWEADAQFITADTMVYDKDYLLCGFVVVASADGGDATLYARQSAEAASSLGQYKALANSPTVVMFPRPILLTRGLYVDIGSNCSGVLIVGAPASRSQA